MKKIDFPQPVHERAVEVMEKAKKELEALGFGAGFTASVECRNVLPLETHHLNGEPATVRSYAVLQIAFSAAIEI